MKAKGLFENIKYCELCRRPLSNDFEGDVCPACEEQALFQEVKTYIRENDVTEYDVAEHFGIPKYRIKQWIREGRIEYKEKELNKHITFHCQKCGAQISFGTLCTKCLKSSNMAVHSQAQEFVPTRMRFLEGSERK